MSATKPTFTMNRQIPQTLKKEYAQFPITESIKKYSEPAQSIINKILNKPSFTGRNQIDIKYFLSLGIIYEAKLLNATQIDKINKLAVYYKTLIENQINEININKEQNFNEQRSQNFKEQLSHQPVINIQFSDHYKCPQSLISIIKNNRVTQNVFNFYGQTFGTDLFTMVISGCGFFIQEQGAKRQHIHQDNTKNYEDNIKNYDDKITEKLRKINSNGSYTNINRTITILIALNNQYAKYNDNNWINNGSTNFELKSHHNHEINETDINEQDCTFFTPLLHAGDCVIFGGDLVHCAGSHNYSTSDSRKLLYFTAHLVPKCNITSYLNFDVNELQRESYSSINKNYYGKFIYEDTEWKIETEAKEPITIPSVAFNDEEYDNTNSEPVVIDLISDDKQNTNLERVVIDLISDDKENTNLERVVIDLISDNNGNHDKYGCSESDDDEEDNNANDDKCECLDEAEDTDLENDDIDDDEQDNNANDDKYECLDEAEDTDLERVVIDLISDDEYGCSETDNIDDDEQDNNANDDKYQCSDEAEDIDLETDDEQNNNANDDKHGCSDESEDDIDLKCAVNDDTDNSEEEDSDYVWKVSAKKQKTGATTSRSTKITKSPIIKEKSFNYLFTDCIIDSQNNASSAEMNGLGERVRYVKDSKVRRLRGGTQYYNQSKLVKCIQIDNHNYGYVIYCERFERYLIEFALPMEQKDRFHPWLIDVKKKLAQIDNVSNLGGPRFHGKTKGTNKLLIEKYGYNIELE